MSPDWETEACVQAGSHRARSGACRPQLSAREPAGSSATAHECRRGTRAAQGLHAVRDTHCTARLRL